MKKAVIAVITACLLLLGATGVLATTLKSPAEIYAELKGISLEEAYTERAAGASFGQLAAEAGVLEEFQAGLLANRKDFIQERVANGQLTQEQAEFMIQNMEKRQALCDGSGMYSRKAGGSLGQGTGLAQGQSLNVRLGRGIKGALSQGSKGVQGAWGCWALPGGSSADTNNSAGTK
ncbi:MAG TPA: DUF2680 domain-containing protein [Peptococcaceae bacterium]|nr:DUF2680 domain-containing protein [Peptococcaceae bacterium]